MRFFDRGASCGSLVGSRFSQQTKDADALRRLAESAKELGVSLATWYRWFLPVKVIKTVSGDDSLLDGDNGSLNQASKLLS